jgi:hypothetical protein
VFSTTSTIRTFADAAAQADPLREAILRHAGRGLAALDAPPPEPAATTAPPVAKQAVNLTQALRKRSRATPSPTPSSNSDAGLTPVSEIVRASASGAPAPAATATPRQSAPPPPAVAAAPARASTVLVVDSAGTTDPALLARGSDALVAALRSAGVLAARLPVGRSVIDKNAAIICNANAGTQRFYAPTLTVGRTESGAPTARLVVDSIDCTGEVRSERAASGTVLGSRKSAADAVDLAAKTLGPQLAGT